MKIYVAGKNLDRAQLIMDILRESGHTVTFDWIVDIKNEKDPTKKARDERKAIRQADVLVYLWESDQESARYEAGMAMGLSKPIIVSGFKKKSFFFSLPEVICVPDDSDILALLKTLERDEMKEAEQDFWIEMSIYEVEAQAEFARVSLENIFRKGSERNSLVFSSIHSLLSHCAVISKLLKASSNGVTIGDILKIKEDSIIHQRKYRNNLEHYDEELKKWIKKKGVNANIGMDNIGSKSSIGVPDMFFIRHFDNQTHTFTLLDEEFNLVSLLDEVRIIKKKASTWIIAVQTKTILPPYKPVFH